MSDSDVDVNVIDVDSDLGEPPLDSATRSAAAAAAAADASASSSSSSSSRASTVTKPSSIATTMPLSIAGLSSSQNLAAGALLAVFLLLLAIGEIKIYTAATSDFRFLFDSEEERNKDNFDEQNH